MESFEESEARATEFRKTIGYRYFWKYLLPKVAQVFIRSELDIKEIEATKRIFKFAEIVFKITGWFSVIGAFKYLADKTGSIEIYVIYTVLSCILWSVFLVAPLSINFLLFWPADSRNKKIANTIFYCVALQLVYFFMFSLTNSIVAELQKIR